MCIFGSKLILFSSLALENMEDCEATAKFSDATDGLAAVMDSVLTVTSIYKFVFEPLHNGSWTFG